MKASIKRAVPQDGSIIVLGRYCDALDLSVSGKINASFIETFSRTKKTLRTSGHPQPPPPVIPNLPGKPLIPRIPKSRKYALSLDNNLVYLAIAPPRSVYPALRIEFKAPALYAYTLEKLEEIANHVASFVFEPGFEVLVSRFDVALDFQGDEGWQPPTDTSVKDIISRARQYNVWYGHTLPGCITYGKPKSPLQVQIYDKTRELEKSGKDWMYDVWQENSEFNESLTVWRVEYRFRRKKLREQGINTIPDLLLRRGNLIRAVVGNDETGKESWIRFASPDTRGRRQDRRTAAPWWGQIINASLEGTTLSSPLLVVPDDAGRNLQHTKKMFVAYFERLVLLEGGEDFDPDQTTPEEAFDIGLAAYREHLEEKGRSFPQALHDRRAKMGLPALQPVPERDVTTLYTKRGANPHSKDEMEQGKGSFTRERRAS